MPGVENGTHTTLPACTDRAERDRLLLQHLPQVRYIARHIRDHLPAQVPLEDLIHAGVIGLIDAVGKFDPNKNVQLRSYAHFRIRGAILDSLRALDWSPRKLRRQARRIQEAHRDLNLRLGRAATEPELAVELGMKLDDFQHLLGELRGLDLVSLQIERSDAQSEDIVVDNRQCEAEKDPFYLCLHEEMKSLVATALEDLDEKGREVVRHYYLDELTMKEVGNILGLGESRVSQIHSGALEQLRGKLEKILRGNPRRSRKKQAGNPCNTLEKQKKSGMAKKVVENG